MNIQPVFTRYDINRKIPFDRSSPIVVDHVEDFDTRFIEVYVYESIYNKQVDLKGTTITARIVAALSTEKILLNDNVACTLNSSGNIIIPIDGAVIETLASTLLIEVRITQDTQALVLPFPLYVQMRGSILDDAGIAPESRGTIPELLEAAIAALEEAKNYENLENKPQINGHTLSGNKTSDDLGLQKKLTAGQNITIESDGTISADGGGVTSYNDLTDKPALNNSEILGDYVSDRIYVQDEDGVKSIRFQNIMLDDFYLSDKNKIMTIVYNNSEYNLNKILEAARIISIENGSVWRYSNLPINKGGCLFCLNECTQVYLVLRENLSDKTQIFIRQKTDYVSNWSEWENLTGGGSQIVSGAVNANGTITFTESDGNTFTTTGASVIGPQGNPGQDYVLTEQDKSDIADIVLGELPTTEGVLYGNTNN